MKTPWQSDALSRAPEQFERANKTQWIQRRNIKQLEDGSYTCEMRFISEDVYEELMDQKNFITEVMSTTSEYVDAYNAMKTLLGE